MTGAPPSIGDFNWSRLIYELQLKGMAAMLACHGEPTRFVAGQADGTGPVLELCLPESFVALAETPGMVRLQERLREHFGPALQLGIAYGVTTHAPAQMAVSRRVKTYGEAYEAFMQDEFVHDLLAMGGSIRLDTVKPQAPGEAPRGGPVQKPKP